MSLWRSQRSVAELNANGEGTLVQHLGIEITELGPDYVRGTMPVDARTLQPMGLLHGGASVAFAETLGSTAANLCVDQAQFACVGQEINANHVRSARSGRVVGTARPLHLGGTSHVWAIDIVDETGRLICVSRLTIAVVKRGARVTPAG